MSNRQIWCGPAIAIASAFVPGIRTRSHGLFRLVVLPGPVRRASLCVCWPVPATVVTVFAFRSTARIAWFSVSAT